MIPSAVILASAFVAHAALAIESGPVTAVSFAKEVIPTAAGKIEFWAKLSGFSGSIAVGGSEPYFFQVYDGSTVYHAGFNANDGSGNGGLTGIASSIYTGTGSFFGGWTYEDVFGAGHVDEWHQYVFQWNKDGIAGVADGHQRVAIFIDGVLNSGTWFERPPGTFPALAGGMLNLITTGGAAFVGTGEVTIDEFKIYDGADNLILWNTLGSADEVAHSAVGLNGSFNGGGGAHFVPGISGDALMATPVAGVVPEPSSIALTALGVLVLLGWKQSQV